jgi:hypothetical protein
MYDGNKERGASSAPGEYSSGPGSKHFDQHSPTQKTANIFERVKSLFAPSASSHEATATQNGLLESRKRSVNQYRSPKISDEQKDAFYEETSFEIKMPSQTPTPQVREVKMQYKTPGSYRWQDTVPALNSPVSVDYSEQESYKAWAVNAIVQWLQRHHRDLYSDAFSRWEAAVDMGNLETRERKHTIRVTIMRTEKEKIERMEEIYASGHEIRVTFFSNRNPRCGLDLVMNQHNHCSIG